jgi:hypothetical protein
MFIAAVVVSVVLAFALTGSAYLKLVKDPKIIKSIVETVGVPEDRLWMLAVLELAGAGGLLIGLAWAPLGIAAAIGVILYFIGALIGHVRVRDTGAGSITPPAVLLLIAVAALLLRVSTS